MQHTRARIFGDSCRLLTSDFCWIPGRDNETGARNDLSKAITDNHS